MLGVRPEEIPLELKDHHKWVIWGLDYSTVKKEGDKPSKPPLNPNTFRRMDAQDPDAWMSFEDAYTTYTENSQVVSGIGVVLGEDDPFACVDLDNVPVDDWDTFGVFSYAELSPSETGVHIICKSRDATIFSKTKTVEIYTNKHYITVTGHKIRGSADWIADQTEELHRLKLQIEGTPYTETALELLLQSKHVSDIWEGKAGFSTQSEADMALAHVLVRNGWDWESSIALLKIFRSRGQYHSAQDKTARADYFTHTLEKAMGSLVEGEEAQDYKNEALFNLADPMWIIDRVVPENTAGMIWGPFGVGKTFFALDMCLRTVCGMQWFGRTITGGDTFYILGEGVASVKHRVRAWYDYHKNPRRIHNFILRPYSVQLNDRTRLQAMARYIKIKYPDIQLLVIDTLSRSIVGLDENTQQDMSIVVDALTWLTNELQCAVVIVHHAGKTGESARGSSVIEAAVDWAIHIDHTRVPVDGKNWVQVPGIFRVEPSKSRQADPFKPFIIYLNDQDSQVVVEYSDHFTSCIRSDQATSSYKLTAGQICSTLEAFHAAGGQPVNVFDIADRLRVSRDDMIEFLHQIGLT